MIFLTVETEHMLQLKCLHADLYVKNPDIRGDGHRRGAIRRWLLYHESRDSVDGPTDDRKHPRKLPCLFCYARKQWEDSNFE